MTLPLFPTLAGATYPIKKTPVWNTDVHISVSGKRTTLARQSFPIYRIEIPYSFLRSDAANLELQDLVAFFNSVNGRANLFRFNDPDDNSVTAQGFGTGDGSTVDFQLVRAMTGKSFSWVDPVFYPTGTPKIYDNGSLLTLTTDYTISSTGMVTFVVAPLAGHALTWTGTYDWLCRFDDDAVDFEKFMQTIWKNKAIRFSTEKI